jgi:hypothetical protein
LAGKTIGRSLYSDGRGLKSSLPLLKKGIYQVGVELGSIDLRRQKIALSITRCIVQFGRIQGYGKYCAISE